MSVAIGDPAIGAVGLIGPPARSLRDVLRRGVAERSRTGVDREHPLVAALDRVAEELIERAERREPTMAVDRRRPSRSSFAWRAGSRRSTRRRWRWPRCSTATW